MKIERHKEGRDRKWMRKEFRYVMYTREFSLIDIIIMIANMY